MNEKSIYNVIETILALLKDSECLNNNKDYHMYLRFVDYLIQEQRHNNIKKLDNLKAG